MVKGYVKPPVFNQGTCFICKNECNPEAYCHFECALSYAEAKDKLVKEQNKSLEN